MQKRLKKLISYPIMYFIIQTIFYIFIRLPLVKNYALGLELSQEQTSTIQSFYATSWLSGLFSLAFNPLSRVPSWQVGHPVYSILLPFLEKTLMGLLVVIFVTSLLSYIFLTLYQKQVYPKWIDSLFASNLLLLLISIGTIFYFFQNRSVLMYDGYRDRIFNFTHQGMRFLVLSTILIFTLLILQNFIRNSITHEFVKSKDKSIYLLELIQSNLKYLFGIWIIMIYFLNMPMIERQTITAALYFDMTVLMEAINLQLILYFSILILIELILFAKDAEQEETIFQEQSRIKNLRPMYILIISGKTVVVTILALVGFSLRVDYINSLNANSDFISGTTNNLPVGSEGHPLGTTSNGQDLLLVIFYFFYIHLLTSIIMVLMIVIFGVLVKKVPIMHKYLDETRGYFEVIPLHLILPVLFVILIIPIDNFMVNVFTFSLIGSVLLFYKFIPIFDGLNTTSTKLIVVMLNSYLMLFVVSLFLGMYKSDISEFLTIGSVIFLSFSNLQQRILLLGSILLIFTFNSILYHLKVKQVSTNNHDLYPAKT